MKYSHKIVLSTAGSILLVGLWIMASFWIFKQTERAVEERKQAFLILNRANELLSELRDAETGQRGYLLTGDEAFLQPYLASIQSIPSHLKELQQEVLRRESHGLADELTPLIGAKLEEMAQVIEIRRQQGATAAIAVVINARGKQLMDSIRSVLRNFIRQEEEALVQRDSKLQVEMRRMFAVLVAASLVALLCALIFVASLKRGSEMRLKNLVYLESQRFLEIQQEANQQLQRTNLTLEISEEKLAVTLKSIGDGVIATDAAGRVTLLNPLAEQLTGWTQADATGRPMGEILSIIDHDTRQPATLPARDGEGPGPVPRPADSVLLRARDGSERAIDGGSAPIRNREGQVAGTVQVFRDVTDRQRADRELRRALAELNQANADLAQGGRLKDEFLANMSHELRTPLNAILGLSEALLEQATGPLTPRQAKSIGIIATSGTHLLTLINDILDLSKVEAGKLELSPETLNLQDFCESCLLFVRTQAIQKNIGVAFEPGDRAVKFSADPKRLKQILVNLLTNAVKFTPEGGHIGLTVAESKDGDLLRFTVWDTGIGIAPADERKLFRAFTQIDSGLTRAQEGTGLGLALVAKLVELHGGGLTLESEPGKGSRFIVTLPQVAAALAPPSALKVWADRRGYSRALVIEDDTTSGAILVNYLTELGLSSVLHARGEQSVEAVLRERPDVILLDVQLPGDSGWVVLVRLKEHPGTRDIPVVIVSVVDEPGRSRALGAAAHFTKPVTRAQLAGFLQRDPVTVLRSPAIGALPLPSGPTILLAEDNEANIQTMGGYLEDKGYRMHYARDGLEAVKLVRELHPELILMDIQMPVMDGLAAIREIRRDPALTAIPIVALTALAMPGDRDRCLAAGATDYMSKPVSMKALAELVKRLAPPMVPSLQPASS